MADETSANVPAGASNNAPKAPPDAPAIPEPQILEEVIIPREKKGEPPPPTPVQPERKPAGSSLPPPLQRDIPPPVPPKPAPVPPSPPAPPPPPPPAPPLPSLPATSAPASLPPPPTPATPPLPSRTPAEFAKEQEAIANILKDIKLPERRLPPETPQKEQKVFDTTLGLPAQPARAGGAGASAQTQASVPPPVAPVSAPASIPAEASAPQKSGGGLASSIVAPLRTLKNDLQEIIRVKKISLVRAAALEQEKHRPRAEEERQLVSQGRSRRSFGILFAAGLFVTLGAAAFFGVFIIMGQRSGIPAETPQSSILFAENGVPFPLDNNSSIDLKRLLAQARRGQGGTLGSITRIIPTVTETAENGAAAERSATLKEFLSALGTRVPDELLRALPDNFFFGIHTVDENAPLFVIPVVSYERAFAGMLRWEDTLNADLSPIFTPVPDQALGAGGLPEKRRFEDVVMRNYDVRVLKNDAGTIELYYSFPTRELLIIAESPYSFTEILSRLRAERKL
ncbi:hypothetical protein HY414_02070 [Candidatus Kaiserbacteria bacterium]|nr:hypothetical protein [Candidatus Kaiserbacteria bacterium]